jgi:hypothetical protein
MKTLQQLAKESLDIQDACNSCGLAQRFAKVMIELHQHPDYKGTDWLNKHPIVQMWISKFEHLAGLDQSSSLETYGIVADLADGATTNGGVHVS